MKNSLLNLTQREGTKKVFASLLSILICAGYFLWLRKKARIPA